jgi:hypothetical protein
VCEKYVTKQDKIPGADIERAIKRKNLFEANPKAHIYETEI